jgi:superfamily II DNA helicase RecQ
MEIHDKKPTNLQEFAEISGVGTSKLKRYGNIFLELIRQEKQEMTE